MFVPSLLVLLLYVASNSLVLCENKVCSADAKFRACCHQIGVSGDAGQLINAACKYPPEELSIGQLWTLSSYITEFVACITDGQDNTAKCAAAGVPSHVSWGLFFSADCQDFCRGNANSLEGKTAHQSCSPHVETIIRINKESVNLKSDTAMRNSGKCKGWYCERPMQWTEQC